MGGKKKMTTPGDLTIRLTPEERASIEKVADAQFLPVSTWLRQLALRAVASAREEEARQARRKEWLSQMKEELWRLPPSPEHAEEVERARKRDWGRR